MEEEDHARQDVDRRRDADGVRRAARPLPQAAGLFGLADGRGSGGGRAQVQGAVAKAAASTCRSARPSSPRALACASISSASPGWSTARWRHDRSRDGERACIVSRAQSWHGEAPLHTDPIGMTVDRRELAPAQQQQARRQSAAAANPAPHRRRDRPPAPVRRLPARHTVRPRRSIDRAA